MTKIQARKLALKRIQCQPRYKNISQQPRKVQMLWYRQMAMAENVVHDTFSRTGYNPIFDGEGFGGELFDWMADQIDYRIQKLTSLTNQVIEVWYPN